METYQINRLADRENYKDMARTAESKIRIFYFPAIKNNTLQNTVPYQENETKDICNSILLDGSSYVDKNLVYDVKKIGQCEKKDNGYDKSLTTEADKPRFNNPTNSVSADDDKNYLLGEIESYINSQKYLTHEKHSNSYGTILSENNEETFKMSETESTNDRLRNVFHYKWSEYLSSLHSIYSTSKDNSDLEEVVCKRGETLGSYDFIYSNNEDDEDLEEIFGNQSEIFPHEESIRNSSSTSTKNDCSELPHEITDKPVENYLMMREDEDIESTYYQSYLDAKSHDTKAEVFPACTTNTVADISSSKNFEESASNSRNAIFPFDRVGSSEMMFSVKSEPHYRESDEIICGYSEINEVVKNEDLGEKINAESEIFPLNPNYKECNISHGNHHGYKIHSETSDAPRENALSLIDLDKACPYENNRISGNPNDLVSRAMPCIKIRYYPKDVSDIKPDESLMFNESKESYSYLNLQGRNSRDSTFTCDSKSESIYRPPSPNNVSDVTKRQTTFYTGNKVSNPRVSTDHVEDMYAKMQEETVHCSSRVSSLSEIRNRKFFQDLDVLSPANLHLFSSKRRTARKTTKCPDICDLCGKRFSCKSNLYKHRRTVHLGERIHDCDVCKKSFTQKAHLQMHHSVHTGEKPFHCRLCNASFSRKPHLKRHLSGHMGEKRFRCAICNILITRKEHLRRHERTHTVEHSLFCTVYRKPLTRKNRLQSREGPGQSHRCEICGISFTQKEWFDKHKCLIPQTFDCNICGKSFLIKLGLIMHSKEHG